MKKIILFIIFIFVTSCSKVVTFKEEEPFYCIEYIIGEQNVYQYDFYGTKDSRYELIVIGNYNVLIVWYDKNMARFAIKTQENVTVLKFIRLE